MHTRFVVARAMAGLVGLAVAGAVPAAELRVAVLQAQEGDARRVQGLAEYLAKRGIAVRWVQAADYRAAAEQFDGGTVDAMFGGTGVACAMLIKGVAEPFARPIFKRSAGVHFAVVVAKKGTPPFDGRAEWFAGRRVAFVPLAASGEFFFRALGHSQAAAVLTAPTHDRVLETVGRGDADVAVVRDHVWATERWRYPQLEVVGGDEGTNPDLPVVVSTRLDRALAASLFEALASLEHDPSPEATAARAGLGIRGYVRATAKDFRHTIRLVQRAGVTKGFAYRF